MQSQWPVFVSKFSGAFSLSRLVGFASSFTTVAHAEQYEQFFSANNAPTAERAWKQTAEKIRANAAWLQRDEKEIADWLRTHQ